jgi:hypothetical protein
VSPTGHRLVMQSGLHAFGNTEKVTLTVQMRRLVAALPEVMEAPAGAKLTNLVGNYLPWVSASHLAVTGLPTPYKVIVSRLYHTVGTPLFAYTLLGW